MENVVYWSKIFEDIKIRIICLLFDVCGFF